MDVELCSSYHSHDQDTNSSNNHNHTVPMGSMVLKFGPSSSAAKHTSSKHHDFCACSTSQLGYLECAISIDHICRATCTTSRR